MILLFNVFVTPDPSSYNINYFRGNLPSFDKFDILKYTISSLAVIPWKKAIINIELGSVYKIFESTIREHVEKEFQHINYKYSKNRAKSLKDWQKIANHLLEYKSEILWYAGNHDHVFLSKNLDLFYKIENLLKTNDEPFNVVHHSHRCFARCFGHEIHPEYMKTITTSFDAMTCLKIEYFWEFWNSFDCSDLYIPRSDWVKTSEQNLVWNLYSYHEVVSEHFDGSHFFHNNMIAANNDPPLTIPENFYTDLKIKFGKPEPGYYTFNPLHSESKVIDPINGVDSFLTLEDIPLFWKSRIKEIKIDSDIDLQLANDIAAVKKVKALYANEFTSQDLTQRQVDLILAHKNIFSIKDDFIQNLKKKI
jgi:hypothetical protein